MNELDLFVAAVAITDPAGRAAFLDRECSGNPTRRQRLDALILGNEQSRHPLDCSPAAQVADRPHSDATATFGSPPAEPTSDYPSKDEHAGAVIAGKYTLVEPIGEGGMGSVWRAKQTEPVKRFVAVKLIKAGMDSKTVLARFDAERQALALMDHPNIAKVLDGGLHEHRPYFVMELVKGVPITEYCDHHKLTPKGRLELFVPVCQAIQHAHQKGVIHRDIKPSNVMVALYDDKPVVKVIDFGVAKATGGALTEQTLDTGFGGVVGTPQYMSPEQATFNNLDIDTRSDVYALGVLLYELLTGSTPFAPKELEKRGLLEILRVVREEEPLRPSTKLSTADALPTLSANRGTEPKKLTGLLRNELDWIVMKALEKDRTRRYETANGFAADVLRYLGGEAVQAHPPSRGYRLKKFVKRNKGQVLAASLVFLALVAGFVGTTWGLIRAERANAALAKKNVELDGANADLTLSRAAVQQRYDLAVKAIETFHTGVSQDFLLKEDKFKDLRDRLLKSASDFYDQLSGLLKDNADLASRRAILRAKYQVAQLTNNVGQKEAALSLHRSVLADRESLAALSTADTDQVLDVAQSLLAVGMLQEELGVTRESLATLEKARRTLQAIPEDTSFKVLAAIATCEYNIGSYHAVRGQRDIALEHFERARSIQEKLCATDTQSDKAQTELGSTLNGMGVLFSETGSADKGLEVFQALLNTRQAQADRHADSLPHKQRLSQAHKNMSYALGRLNRNGEALSAARKARTIQAGVVEARPAVSYYRGELARTDNSIGINLYLLDRKVEALTVQRGYPADS